MVLMSNLETKRCDNLSCVCEIPIAEAVCSEHCARAEHGDAVSLRCECGHDACTQEMQRELSGTMGAPAAP
jgi:hypothetical protein